MLKDCDAALLIGATALTVLAWLKLITPETLLAFCFIVGSGNAMPGIEQLSLSIAGRHEKYSDFGSTTNPSGNAALKTLVDAWAEKNKVEVQLDFLSSSAYDHYKIQGLGVDPERIWA